MAENLGAQEAADLLPLEGVTFDDKGSVAPAVEIMLGGTAAANLRHLTHTLVGVERVVPKAGTDGREEALEIETKDGAKAILVFETLPTLPKSTP
jgi:hypothetical protein